MNQSTQSMPWERRLNDLGHLLKNCSSTYLDPDLFRMNTNQFLQTARTVTFIIQKNKSYIKDFDIWYKKNVIDLWAQDEVMQWAKNSRNIIEKQGDLEINSTLDVSLIFSYLEEDDIKLKIGRQELLNYGVKKLVRFSQKHLPSGITDAAVVRISRNWVTKNLSNWELLHALVYVYCRHYDTHRKLCKHLQTTLSKKLLDPAESNSIREEALNPYYLKLNDLNRYSIRREVIHHDSSYKPPPELMSKINEIQNNFKDINSVDSALSHFLEFAAITFRDAGFHISILHLFDDNWSNVDLMTTIFADHADKYIFWRSIGERVKSQRITAIVWTSELWHRSLKGHPSTAIKNLPITGEGLMVSVLDASGNFKQATWEISRDADGNNPVLSAEPSFNVEYNTEAPYFFAPIARAMGGDAAKLFENTTK